jgi:hypothetical protein
MTQPRPTKKVMEGEEMRNDGGGGVGGGGSPVDASSLETRTNDDSKKTTARPTSSYGGGREIEPMKRSRTDFATRARTHGRTSSGGRRKTTSTRRGAAREGGGGASSVRGDEEESARWRTKRCSKKIEEVRHWGSVLRWRLANSSGGREGGRRAIE